MKDMLDFIKDWEELRSKYVVETRTQEVNGGVSIEAKEAYSPYWFGGGVSLDWTKPLANAITYGYERWTWDD